MLISVIVPVYNKEKYLDACINSITHQTYSKMEIIIIDDGSTDNSQNIISIWKQRDARIKCYIQKNQGVSVARNKGISMATGEYIYFVDADDVIERDAIESKVRIITEKKVDILISNFSINNKGKIKKSTSLTSGNLSIEDLLKNQIIADMFLVNGRPLSSVCNRLYRLEFLLKNSILFEDKIFSEDRLFNLKCYVNSPLISINNNYTYIYNTIENSRSRTIDNTFYTQSISLFNTIYEYLHERKDLEDYKELLEINLIYDIDKILKTTYEYTEKGKIRKVDEITKLLKNNTNVINTLKQLQKNNTINKLDGNRNYLGKIRLVSKLITNYPSIFVAFYYYIYSYIYTMKRHINS